MSQFVMVGLVQVPVPTTLNALRVLSLADGVLLVGLIAAAATGHEAVVAILGPTHGVLFLLLLATLVGTLHWGWWSWRFVAAVAMFGPLASVPGLERAHRRQLRAR